MELTINEALEDFSEELRNWYFLDGGGMYLSRKAHEKGYIPLQEAITAALNRKGELTEEPVTPKEYDEIRELCSNLRTHLTEDILSRKLASRQGGSSSSTPKG